MSVENFEWGQYGLNILELKRVLKKLGLRIYNNPTNAQSILISKTQLTPKEVRTLAKQKS